MSVPIAIGTATFVLLFVFHAYRTVYVYTLLPRWLLVGDFFVSAVTGALVAGLIALALRDAA